jgi:cysteinyl-tRNA synthetase
MDFALWKKSKPGEPGYESPWGKGRPGWHIECSTMSTMYLGETLDIHGGGMDLMFPHHESEIMQSEAHTGKKFCNFWLHNGFINVNKEKMSKSLGNFFTIRDVLGKYEPEVLRYFLVSTHYRSQIEFADSLLDDAKAALARLRNTVQTLEHCNVNESHLLEEPVRKAIDGARQRFIKGMDDDFNTREAVAALHDLANAANQFLAGTGVTAADRPALLSAFHEIGDVLGLLGTKGADTEVVDGLIRLLANIRQEARTKKDYQTSDKIRDRLKEAGIILEDSVGGFKWRFA